MHVDTSHSSKEETSPPPVIVLSKDHLICLKDRDDSNKDKHEHKVNEKNTKHGIDQFISPHAVHHIPELEEHTHEWD